MSPPDVDAQLLSGPALPNLHRTTALQLFDAQQNHQIHLVRDMSEVLQIVAVCHNAATPLNTDSAHAGCDLLLLAGPSLDAALCKHGLLEEMHSASLGKPIACARLARINAVFSEIRYVLVRAPGQKPWPLYKDPLCTCPAFARYGGCEHAEFVKMLDLRLREQSSEPDHLPILRRKGRKPGQCLTRRGASAAAKAAKSKPKAKATSKQKPR